MGLKKKRMNVKKTSYFGLIGAKTAHGHVGVLQMIARHGRSIAVLMPEEKRISGQERGRRKKKKETTTTKTKRDKGESKTKT